MAGLASSSNDRAGERSRAERDQEIVDRRLAVERALTVGCPVWLLFFAVDVYVVFLLGADAPLRWFGFWRVVIGVVMLVSMMTLKRSRTFGGMIAAEMGAFCGASFGVALLATRYGGLTSHYVQGMSIVIMFHSAAIPDRFRRGLSLSMVMAAFYPGVMAAAALWDPRIATQWRTPAQLYLFIQDFVFVFATAIMAPIGGHLVWAARKQVFEARKLGRYRLKARIGVGGGGEVWLAEDEQEKREIALKILERAASTRPGARARFEREARAAMSLSCRHTIRVFDWGASDDGVCFIAMELLDGADLGTVVRGGGPIAPERAVHFARQACASLGEAHAGGILHRDIKPENLFVCRIGDEVDVLKVLDFGLAKVARPDNDDATLTQGVFVGGTPLYMAPETCAGLEGDSRSDVYSLGATLYFVLTGTPPFTADTTAGILEKHLRSQPEPPSQRVPIPAELERVILRCLAKRPAERFSSVRELDAALAACGPSWTQRDARALWSMRGPAVHAG